MKIITFYLPQYHEIEENNTWWGNGFTEWENVKTSKPVFEGHNQPRVPLNNNYYNLLDNDVFKWQISLAKKYGVYGFCFYHYWFNGKLLLNEPLENFLKDKSLDINFSLCWANENWVKRTPSGDIPLIKQEYGDKADWKAHFDYLLLFFKDERYIKENNMPQLIIYRPDVILKLNEMLDYWTELAKKNGFDGICYSYQHVSFDKTENKDDSRFTYNIEYQPQYSFYDVRNERFGIIKKSRRRILSFMEKYFNIDLRNKLRPQTLEMTDYDNIWERILSKKPENSKSIPGAFVDWDNSPRYGKHASVCHGSSPTKFEKYMTKQIFNAKENYNSDTIYLFAWNEWGESGYLEPDEKNKYKYLEALKNALVSTNEFPKEINNNENNNK